MSGNQKECNAILWVSRYIYYFNMEFSLVDGCRPRGEKSIRVLHVFSLSNVDSIPSKDRKVRKLGFKKIFKIMVTGEFY